MDISSRMATRGLLWESSNYTSSGEKMKEVRMFLHLEENRLDFFS